MNRLDVGFLKKLFHEPTSSSTANIFHHKWDSSEKVEKLVICIISKLWTGLTRNFESGENHVPNRITNFFAEKKENSLNKEKLFFSGLWLEKRNKSVMLWKTLSLQREETSVETKPLENLKEIIRLERRRNNLLPILENSVSSIGAPQSSTNAYARIHFICFEILFIIDAKFAFAFRTFLFPPDCKSNSNIENIAMNRVNHCTGFLHPMLFQLKF